MAVLVLLILLVTQLLNGAIAVTTESSKHMDADSQARLVFDRMAVDFSSIVKRPDVDYYFQKNAGNDQLAFYSESTGYFSSGVSGETPKSNVSLVGYRINKDSQLERLSKALVWNGVTNTTSGASGLTSADKPMTFLPQTLVGTWPEIEGDHDDPDYQVIGDQVYRLEICYLLKNGIISPPSPILSGTAYTAPNTSFNGLQDVAAIVVTIAVLDSKSRLLVSGTGMSMAASKLKDVSGFPIDHPPSKLWEETLRKREDLGLPKVAAAQVRIYQRYFYLD